MLRAPAEDPGQDTSHQPRTPELCVEVPSGEAPSGDNSSRDSPESRKRFSLYAQYLMAKPRARDMDHVLLQTIQDTIGLYWSDSDDSDDSVWGYSISTDSDDFCSDEDANDDEEDLSYEEEEEEELSDEEATDSQSRPDPGRDALYFEDSRLLAALSLHVSEAQLQALEGLLQAEPRTHAFFYTVTRALYKVSEQGLRRVAELLVHNGAQMFSPFGISSALLNGYGLLRQAVSNADTAMVRLILNNGFSLKLMRCEQSILLWACEKDTLECVRTLLDLGADVNARDEDGCPLLVAMFQESIMNLEILKLLLDRGLDPNAEFDEHMTLQECISCHLKFWMNSEEENVPKHRDHCVQILHLLLRHGFRLQRCRRPDQRCLLRLALDNYNRLFPLAGLLLERGEEFSANEDAAPFKSNDVKHGCCSYFEVLREALCSSVQQCSEAGACSLVDKANALLDLPIVEPPLLRFTLGMSQEQGAGAVSDHQGAVWTVDTAPASLQSLCCSFIRHWLLPWPLEPKIQALPLPDLLKEQLMPLK